MPLGLADSITACLFDLDGVLTQTAKVHAAAWKQMFDAFLRERAERRRAVRRRSRRDGLRELRRRQAALRRRAVVPGVARDRPARGLARRPARRGDGRRPRQPQERPRADLIDEQGVELYEGSVRFVEAARDAGLRRAVVSASKNCRDGAGSGRHRRPVRGRVDGVVAEEQGLRGKPAPDTFLEGARRLGVEPAAGGRLRGRARRGRSGPGRRLRLRRRRRPGRAGRRARRPRRRPGRPGPRRAAGRTVSSVIRQRVFAVEPWAVRESRLDLDLLAQTESVFALSNGHIGLRGNLDEGEPHGLPGTYLNGFYEARPLPYAEAGYGYPGVGQTVINVTNGKLIRLLVDDEPFDVRYGELRRHVRVLDLRAGTLEREVEWVSPTGQPVRIRSDPLRLLRPARDRGDQLRGRAARGHRRGSSCSPSWSPTSRSRAPPTTRARPRSRRRSSPSTTPATTSTPCSSTGRRRAGCGWRRGWTTGSTGPDGTTAETETSDDFARTTVTAELGPGKPLRLTKFIAYGWSSRRSTPALRDQVEGALAEAEHTGWDGLLGDAARVPRQLLGAGRRRGRRRAAHPAGAAVRDVPRPPGGVARPGEADPGQGADRLGLRRARVLGHGDVRAADAHLLGAACGARRAALAPRQPLAGQGARGAARARRGRLPVADDQRRRVLRLLAGRDGGVPRQRRHRQRDRALHRRDRRRRLRPRAAGSRSSSRRRGCGGRSATTTRPGRSGSTA